MHLIAHLLFIHESHYRVFGKKAAYELQTFVLSEQTYFMFDYLFHAISIVHTNQLPPFGSIAFFCIFRLFIIANMKSDTFLNHSFSDTCNTDDGKLKAYSNILKDLTSRNNWGHILFITDQGIISRTFRNPSLLR